MEMPIEKIDRAKLDKEKFIPDIRQINLEPEEKQRDFVNELADEKSGAMQDEDSSQSTDKLPSYKQPLLESKSAPQVLGRMTTRERLL